MGVHLERAFSGIAGMLMIAIGSTSYMLLGLAVGLLTAAIMFISDNFPDPMREEKLEP